MTIDELIDDVWSGLITRHLHGRTPAHAIPLADRMAMERVFRARYDRAPNWEETARRELMSIKARYVRAGNPLP